MEETKKCPYCAEEINKEAIFCKHCRMDLVTQNTEQNQNSNGMILSIFGFIGGLILVALVIWGVSHYQETQRKDLFATESVGLVNQLLRKNGVYGTTCKKVTLGEEISENFYSANAYLSNGNTLTITVEGTQKYLDGFKAYDDNNEHWYIEVKIPNQ